MSERESQTERRRFANATELRRRRERQQRLWNRAHANSPQIESEKDFGTSEAEAESIPTVKANRSNSHLNE